MLQIQQQEILQDTANQHFTRNQCSYDCATVLIRCPKSITANSRALQASITVAPKYQIYNSPIQIDIRGCSCLQNFQHIKSNRKNEFQMTESCLIQGAGEEKMEAILLERREEQTSQSKQAKAKGIENRSKIDQNGQQGEYFLQGSLILFQLDEENQERLESLLPNKRYEYPVEFTLPPNLPTSLQSLLLKNIHVSIKYTLELKFSFCKVGQRKGEWQQLILSFAVVQQPKAYPFQELVVTQDIRYYHQNGRKQDEFLRSWKTSLLRCLCPNTLVDYYISSHKKYNSIYCNYDLYHLQLLVAVSKDQSIYLTVRAYKDPQQDQLTQSRDKRNKNAKQAQVAAIDEVAPDVSLASIKRTQMKPPQPNIQKVEVAMVGQITNLCQQTVFQKTIYLTHSNYDMVQGQCLVQLRDYLHYTKSCHNELFTLRYCFELKAHFQEQEGTQLSFETFVTKQENRQLML